MMRSSPLAVTRRQFVKLMGGAVYLASRSSTQVSSSGIRLQNVAPGNGLDFVLRNDAAGRKYQVETVLGGLAVIDFDHDGWPDLYCVNGAALPSLQKTDARFHNRLYRNNRNGTFTDVTERAGVQGHGYEMGAAVGDYNSDGLADIYVVGVHGNTLYRNNGDGSFTDVTKQAGVGGNENGRKLWSVAAAWIDYDNDGHLDLLVSNYCDWDPGTDPLCGGLNGAARAYCHPDMYRAEPMVLYHNNGDGTFTDVSREAGIAKVVGKGMGIAVADFDGDGLLDSFIANDNARNLLLQNKGGKGMEEVGVEAGVAFNGDGRQISGMGADFRDYDGDGLPDIVMTGLKGETFELFRNRGDGSFQDASARSGLLGLSRAFSGWGCGFVDLDNDGWLDLFVANGGLDTNEPQPNCIFRNRNGHFSDVSAEAGHDFETARLHRGCAFADFDNDGRIDIAVASLNQPIELWMNRTPPRHWLQLTLTGRRSNRSALGTKVICRGSQRAQVTSVANSVGYASSSDLRVHFGLGDDQKVSLEIHWPSGAVQKLADVQADQRLEVEEPSPASAPATSESHK